MLERDYRHLQNGESQNTHTSMRLWTPYKQAVLVLTTHIHWTHMCTPGSSTCASFFCLSQLYTVFPNCHRIASIARVVAKGSEEEVMVLGYPSTWLLLQSWCLSSQHTQIPVSGNFLHLVWDSASQWLSLLLRWVLCAVRLVQCLGAIFPKMHITRALSSCLKQPQNNKY